MIFEDFFLLLEALKITEHFKISLYSLPLLQSPFVIIHKALRYKLTCSVDHIIGQAILICCLVGGRVGKDTKRSLKGKSTELMIQNVWSRQTLAGEYEENFLLYNCLTRCQSRFPYEKLKSLNMHRGGLPWFFFSFQIEVFFSRKSSFTNFFSCSLNIPSGLYTTVNQ